MARVARPQHFWIVVRSKPNREFWAATNVRRQGYEVYIPKIYNRKAKRREALFPNYLFVRTDGTISWLRSTFGVSHVVMVGEKAATVPNSVISELQARENDHGVIPLENPIELLRPGDIVRIRAGALESRTAIYQGMNNQRRIRLLMTILGVERTTTIDPTFVDPKPVARAIANGPD